MTTNETWPPRLYRRITALPHRLELIERSRRRAKNYGRNPRLLAFLVRNDRIQPGSEQSHRVDGSIPLGCRITQDLVKRCGQEIAFERERLF